MSNLHYRSVLKGLVVSLVSCVNLGATVTDTECGENQFDLLELSNVIAAGVGAGLSLTALPHTRSRGLLGGRYSVSDAHDAHSALHGEGCIIRRNEIYYFPPTA